MRSLPPFAWARYTLGMTHVTDPELDQRTEATARLIGANATRLAEAQGLSLRRLARWMDSSTQTASDLLNGKANPTLRTLTKLAIVLGVEPADLLRNPEDGAQ